MSKELEELEIEKHLKDFVLTLEMGKVDEMFINNSFEIIETALKRKEELERMHTNALDKIAKDRKKIKALDIIKEKRVNVGSFIKCCASLSYEEYKKQWSNWHKDILYNLSSELLTQDEYNLLKGALYE